MPYILTVQLDCLKRITDFYPLWYVILVPLF
eukprot:UN09037